MVDCYRKDCGVRKFGDGACQQRFCRDSCPHTHLGDDDEEGEMDSETGANAEGGETTAEEM